MKKIRQWMYVIAAILATTVFMTGFTGCDRSQKADKEEKEEIGLQQGIVTGRYYTQMAKDPAQFFDTWADMDIEWIRIEFEEFMNFDPTKFAQKVDEYKKIIAEAHKRDIKVLGIVSVNSMANGFSLLKNEESIQKYVEAVEWHLKTYDVDAVEFSNEPAGFLCENKYFDRLAGYARMMIESYTQLKPKYPEVLFVGPVTANAEKGEWLGYHGWPVSKLSPEESIFNCTPMQQYRDQNEGKLPLDIISWHPYGTGGDPLEDGSDAFYFSRTFETYYKQILAYKDVKGRPVIGDYPIWFSEYGWDTGMVTQENQRLFYEHMLAEMKKYPQIKTAFWYTHQDDENEPGTEYKHLGLFMNSRNNYQEKLLYYSFLANNSGVGLKKTGETVDAVVRTYRQKGASLVLGKPAADVVELPDGVYQVMKNSKEKKSYAIIKKNDFFEAFLIQDSFYSYYFNGKGSMKEAALAKTGYPVSNVYEKDGKLYLDAEKGRLSVTKGKKKVTFTPVTEGLKPDFDDTVGLLGKAHISPMMYRYASLGKEALGTPVGPMERFENPKAYIQYFQGGTLGECALYLEKQDGDVYVMQGELLKYYAANRSTISFGHVRSDTYTLENVQYIDFVNGVLSYDGTQVKWSSK